MIFFLAFLLRIVHFGTISDRVALIAMGVGVAAGGFVGTAIGAALRAKASQAMVFGMLAATMVVTALCAAYFGLWAAVIVAFAAALGQTLVKLALDSIVQREISPDIRSSTFAASETLHQLSWVAGALLGLAMSLTASGVIGLAVAAAGLAVSFGLLISTRRSRILRGRQAVRPA
jgi:predicted MFS family arabinose efflux permease